MRCHAPLPLLTVWRGLVGLTCDGIVDATDQALKDQLAIWYRGSKAGAWKQVLSKNDTSQEVVAAALYHFSQYAVCW